MRRYVLVFFALFHGFSALAQDSEQALRDLLLYGPNGDSAGVIWMYQPGGGLNLGGAVALPCLLADLSFDASGEILFADSTEVIPGCPDEISSGKRKLRWEIALIERIGVERLRISDPEDSSTCDFAITERTPALSLATVCAEQDYPRHFRYQPQKTAGRE